MVKWIISAIATKIPAPSMALCVHVRMVFRSGEKEEEYRISIESFTQVAFQSRG